MLSGMLTELLVMVERQVAPRRIGDLSLAIGMSYRIAKTTQATLLLTRALQTELTNTTIGNKKTDAQAAPSGPRKSPR